MLYNFENYMHCWSTEGDGRLGPCITEQPSCLEGSRVLMESSIETLVSHCPRELKVSRDVGDLQRLWGPVEKQQ